MKNIEIVSNINLDDLKERLQYELNTRQLVDFALSLSDNLTDEVDFYNILTKRIEKYKNNLE